MSAFKTWLTGLTSKATPVDADETYLRDSVTGNSYKLTWAGLKATLKTYFDGLYLSLAGGGTVSSGSINFTGAGSVLLEGGGNFVKSYGATDIRMASGGFYSNASCVFAWSGDADSNSAKDLLLYRDAANTLAQRNGATAQTWRNYGTWTDASNGRWLNVAMTTAGVATITPTGNGTGASGNVLHISGLPTSNPGPGILWNNSGVVNVGT